MRTGRAKPMLASAVTLRPAMEPAIRENRYLRDSPRTLASRKKYCLEVNRTWVTESTGLRSTRLFKSKLNMA